MRAYIEALRNPSFKQGRLELWDPATGKVCALGLYLRQVRGMSYQEVYLRGYAVADQDLGKELTLRITDWNDDEGLTFAEIASNLEKLP